MLFNLKKILRATTSATASAAMAVMLFATAMPAANANVIYNNLNASQDGSDPVFASGPLANSFTTGVNGAGTLAGITALLMNGSTEVIGDIEVTLHADSGNAPGAQLVSLGTLSSAAVSTGGFDAYSFAPVTSFLLSASTTYWLEIVATGANAIAWSWSNDLSGPGVAGQSNYGAMWGTNSNNSFGPYQMSVQVPEPGTVALLSLGLGLMLVMSSRRRNNGNS